MFKSFGGWFGEFLCVRFNVVVDRVVKFLCFVLMFEFKIFVVVFKFNIFLRILFLVLWVVGLLVDGGCGNREGLRKLFMV